MFLFIIKFAEVTQFFLVDSIGSISLWPVTIVFHLRSALFSHTATDYNAVRVKTFFASLFGEKLFARIGSSN